MAEDDTVRIDGRKALNLKSGRKVTIVLKRDAKPELEIKFERKDKSRVRAATLSATDGSWQRTLSLSEGSVQGGAVVLRFAELPQGQSFDLTVTQDDGRVQRVFSNKRLDPLTLMPGQNVYPGRFIDLVCQWPLEGLCISVDTPGDRKVSIQSSFQTDGDGLGGSFTERTAYNFAIGTRPLSAEKAQGLRESDLENLNSGEPRDGVLEFPLEYHLGAYDLG